MRLIMLLFAVAVLFGASDGPFAGTWESTRSDASGKIHIRFKPEPEIVFTLNDREVRTKVARSKVTDTAFEIDYDFALEGYELRSSLKGTVQGDGVTGEYRTTTRGDGTPVDAGRFEAKPAVN